MYPASCKNKNTNATVVLYSVNKTTNKRTGLQSVINNDNAGNGYINFTSVALANTTQ
jgi:hypothetical protein